MLRRDAGGRPREDWGPLGTAEALCHFARYVPYLAMVGAYGFWSIVEREPGGPWSGGAKPSSCCARRICRSPSGYASITPAWLGGRLASVWRRVMATRQPWRISSCPTEGVACGPWVGYPRSGAVVVHPAAAGEAKLNLSTSRAILPKMRPLLAARGLRYGKWEDIIGMPVCKGAVAALQEDCRAG